MVREKDYLLGIDIGTSAAKVALFSKEGGNRPLGVASFSYPTAHPAPGYAEQDSAAWWDAVCRATHEVLEETGVPASLIAGVGVDGQSGSAVALDRAGEVLCPTPIWSDTRSAALSAALTAQYGEAVFAFSQNPIHPSYTFPKILWYRENCPDVYKKAIAILQSNGYIVYRLTGKCTHDRSQACGAGFDMAKGEWKNDFLRELSLREDLLPPLYHSHEIVGTITKEAASATGLAEGTPVVAGGLDSACDALGAAVVKEGEAQEQGGQSGGMSICTKTPQGDPRLIVSRHVVPGLFLLQGGTTGGGGVLRWFFSTLCGKGENADLARADEEAAAIAPGADGLLLLPYFSGERTPLWDPLAKGVYFGIDYGKTAAHFHRANLEAAAYALRHNLEVATSAGATIKVLHASGGAAKSPLWTAIKSDVTGYRVIVPEAFSTAAYGAALLAGVATGVYGGFDEAVASIRITREHTPDPAKRAAYDAAYARYRALYDRLAPLMHGEI